MHQIGKIARLPAFRSQFSTLNSQLSTLNFHPPPPNLNKGK